MENDINKAIFDNTTLELNINFNYVLNAKNTFLANLPMYNINELKDNLENILNSMEILLNKYYDTQTISNVKFYGYNFYEAKAGVSVLENINENEAKALAKQIILIAFSCFEYLLRQLKIAIPMQKIDLKKN